jgi:hypothetical protein
LIWKVIDEHEMMRYQTICPRPGLPPQQLQLTNLKLQTVRYAKEIIQEDVSCDSTSMKVHMLSIGEAMHEKYDWVVVMGQETASILTSRILKTNTMSK